MEMIGHYDVGHEANGMPGEPGFEHLQKRAIVRWPLEKRCFPRAAVDDVEESWLGEKAKSAWHQGTLQPSRLASGMPVSADP
jgi:hypothetical protein